MRFKQILLEAEREEVISTLREGLERVARTSHLITSQIRDNKEQFLENLDVDKFISEFGKPTGILGVGVFGAVFDLSGRKALKITFDYYEAPFLYKISKNPRDGIVDIDKVVSFSFGDSTGYAIVRDELTPITQTDYYSEARSVLRDMKGGKRNKSYNSTKKQEVKRALEPMYEMDPNWDGTHIENLGVQGGEVVLYDGFSKNISVSKDSVPSVNLSK